MLINIIIISEVLEHMFYSIKMANRSPFWCPKILFGPFLWLKSFSVFSRTGFIPGSCDFTYSIHFITGMHVTKFILYHSSFLTLHSSLIIFTHTIHVISFKEASGRIFFHFREVFENRIEYIRKCFVHFLEILKFW